LRIGISGHRDLDTATSEQVAAEIRSHLAEHDPSDLVGVSCLANGADQIFAREVLDAGGQLIVVVPASQYRDALPAACHAEYDSLLSAASDIRKLPFVESTSEAHMAASIALLDQVDELVAVWDGKPARSYGGTADVVDEARNRGVAVEVIWPEGAVRAG
jgi:hypothetical protein